MMNVRSVVQIIGTLALSGWLARAQEVSIPDPGLSAAIRGQISQPSGPLTAQKLLVLTNLSAGLQGISSVAGLDAAANLRILDLDNNSITNFPIADALTNLAILDLFNNRLTSFALSNASPNLAILDVAFNLLTQCSLPAGLTKLNTLFLEGNALSEFSLPAGLTALTQLDLSDNHLTSLTLPADLTQLTSLFLGRNQITNLVLPPGMTQLRLLDLDGNPIRTIALSEPLAATNLAPMVAFLRSQGVSVITYPLAPLLIESRLTADGSYTFAINGPPGVYAMEASNDLSAWTVLATINNEFGVARYIDETAPRSPQKFYRVIAGGVGGTVRK